LLGQALNDFLLSRAQCAR